MGEPFYQQPEGRAYNECVTALNEVEEKLDVLLDERDRIWLACNAILDTKRHGRSARRRNPTLFNGQLLSP